MTQCDEISDAIERDGFYLAEQAISAEHVDRFCAALELIDGASVRRRGDVYAIRNLFDAAPAVRELASGAAIRALASAVLGERCFAVQALLLDKIPDANWKVPFHQDLYVPLAARADTPGFSGWSEKAGVVHAKPPRAVLEGILALRVHLDDCGAENGPLRVIPGSHCAGELSGPEIKQWQERVGEVACVAPRGSVLLMRPLLLHASAPALSPGHRRVIQLQFTHQELPHGLSWASRV